MGVGKVDVGGGGAICGFSLKMRVGGSEVVLYWGSGLGN